MKPQIAKKIIEYLQSAESTVSARDIAKATNQTPRQVGHYIRHLEDNGQIITLHRANKEFHCDLYKWADPVVLEATS